MHEMLNCRKDMKVIILTNNCGGLISFRKEVLEALVQNNYEVVVIAPPSSDIELKKEQEIKEIGCRIINSKNLARRGMNPMKDLALLHEYYKILKREKPEVVLTYTIKPNVYGGLACSWLGIPYIVNITGLGTAVDNPGALQKLTVILYKLALRKAVCIFFQNTGNENFFRKYNINNSKHRLIPGSGVNIAKHSPQPYGSVGPAKFYFVSRLMKQKGIEEYFAAAEHFKKDNKNLEFHILGRCEENYEERLKDLENKGLIIYHGLQGDVRPFYKDASCLIHPTFYPEGMSNVVLEAASTARPVITTRRHGCMEAVEEGVTGFLFEERDTQGLITQINKFLAMSIEERAEMGRKARLKMEREFDRQIVVETYLDEINKITRDSYSDR